MREPDRGAREIALLLALTKGVRGRYSLSEQLGLGQGVLRGVYRSLRERGLIAVGRGGARLTAEGFRELERLLRERGIARAEVLEDVEAWGRRYWGVVAALEGGIDSVVEARDAAVRAGARMALIVRREGGRLYLPGVEDYDLSSGAPSIYGALASMPPVEFCAVVLGDKLYPCVKGLLEIASLARASFKGGSAQPHA